VFVFLPFLISVLSAGILLLIRITFFILCNSFKTLIHISLGLYATTDSSWKYTFCCKTSTLRNTTTVPLSHCTIITTSTNHIKYSTVGWNVGGLHFLLPLRYSLTFFFLTLQFLSQRKTEIK
jgi:hypothetical protein